MRIMSNTGSAVLIGLAALASSSQNVGAWSLEDASKPYSGQTVHIVCEGYPPCYSLRDAAAEFTGITGINVEFEFGDLLAITQRMLSEQITKSDYFDGMQVLSYYLPLYGEQKFAAPMSKFLDDPKLRDPSFNPDDFIPAVYQQTSFYKEQQIALPFQYLPTVAIMRKDLLADEGERAAFKAKYGYDLPESKLIATLDTYKQWHDINEFFTRKSGEMLAGKELAQDFYGTVAPFKRHLTIMWTYWATLVSMGGEIYDSEGNVALDKGSAGVDALQYWLDETKASPPSYREYTWDDEYREFCAGSVFSLLYWPDAIYYLEDPEECKTTSGNITYLMLPDTHKTMPFAYSFVVSPNAKNPEAAFLLQQWALSKAVQEKIFPAGWVLSPRKDVMAGDWSSNPQVAGTSRLGNEIADQDLFYTPPGHPAMIASQDIMMEELSAAGAGQIDAKTAVAHMADRLRALIEQ